MREWAESAVQAPSTNRARFLKARQDVDLLLAEGWSVRKIWAFLQSEGRIAVGFSTFARDVKRHLGQPGPARSSTSSAASIEPAESLPAEPPPAPIGEAASPPAEPEPDAPAPRRRFKHNPDPKKEDYV